ncbi:MULTISPECIES: hypothetical protein [unclassified Duganella]|uniref:hypothetical protein n=1 Tax=unclassified Duganella TaxID=2636909 RepID=UPI000883EFF1|nr:MULTISPECIES: hypothetical protein [unclassified Duganella]SDG54632.1 hypothetical protein SAMN05216320_105161 [Duganella sp. OV458]SDJ77271.1 hypothetical protein SAMN05428973_106162 [Duganella sp. OV510]
MNPLTGKKKTAPTIALPYWVREFALIRTAALTMIAAITVSLTGVLLSELKRQEADQQLEASQRARDAAYSRYAQVGAEKRDIRNFQQRFVALRQLGLVGDERRLEWLDAIRQTQDELKLPPLSYEIEPQQAVQLEAPLDLGTFELRGSRMRLHMELLHELDLFNFFQRLRERVYFTVQDCSIKRLGVVAGTPGASSVGADCTLNWITLNTTSQAPAVAAVLQSQGKP